MSAMPVVEYAGGKRQCVTIRRRARETAIERYDVHKCLTARWKLLTGMAEPAHLDEVLAAVQRGCLPAETAPALQALWDADFGFAA